MSTPGLFRPFFSEGVGRVEVLEGLVTKRAELVSSTAIGPVLAKFGFSVSFGMLQPLLRSSRLQGPVSQVRYSLAG